MTLLLSEITDEMSQLTIAEANQHFSNLITDTTTKK
jgi:hypothetical protein